MTHAATVAAESPNRHLAANLLNDPRGQIAADRFARTVGHRREKTLLKVLYLVPNLADPAVGRRIDMMSAGGAQVAVAGFQRANTPAPDLNVDVSIKLAETFDARFAQRVLAVLQARGEITRRVGSIPVPDVIIARNLEMLALASRLQAFWPSRPPIVYECLDIHRLMLRNDVIGRAMRGAEQYWTRKASLLITSSPAFLRNYFDIHGAPAAMLIENKVLDYAGARGINPALAGDVTGPIRIGWFGALRCRRSLEALAQFMTRMQGRFEVILRGRPALTEFDDFHGFVDAQPHMRFEGPYRNPEELAGIYSQVHFAWAIDFFEAGLNSQWLLPNRIYEGCLHGAVPIALEGTETAAFIGRHEIGITLPDIEPETLAARIGAFSMPQVTDLARVVAATDTAHFVHRESDCHTLVQRLRELCAPRAILTEAA